MEGLEQAKPESRKSINSTTENGRWREYLTLSPETRYFFLAQSGT